MLFTQLQFVFIFLPVVHLGYVAAERYFENQRVKQGWLAAASLCFYSYWDYHFLPVILASIMLNYALGIIIESHTGKNRKIAFIIAIAGNLAALAFYKYFDFFITNFNLVSGTQIPLAHILLPLGISFFTFTQIAYLADVYAFKKCERSLTKYTLFVTYFPHLIAGPILHHGEMMPQFGMRDRSVSASKVAIGLTIFGIGLFKKAVFADGFALIADPTFSDAATSMIPTSMAWTGALAYSLQIYFDFSGYSDMAVGLSLMFGILLPFNFDSPYKSQSIAEFWRRWHITLSRFLRDYLYIPLGGNRSGLFRRNTNLFITMVLGGLWHGAGWTFLIWGALHGAYLIINHFWKENISKFSQLAPLTGTMWYSLISLLLTQFLVVIAWVFFRAENMTVAWNMIFSMFWPGAEWPEEATVAAVLPESLLVLFGYLFCLALPNVSQIFTGIKVGLTTYDNKRCWSLLIPKWRPNGNWAIASSALLIVAIFCSAIAGDGSKFLYFQF